jgi:hypothetical protein
VAGSVTAGHFCNNPDPLERSYTLHFDIVFSQPFSARPAPYPVSIC